MESKDAFIDTLSRIRSIALSRASNIHKFASCSKSSTVASEHLAIPDLSLPFPEDISPALIHEGCPSSALAMAVSYAYCRKVNEIRVAYLSSHKKSCQKALQLLPLDSGALLSYQRLIPSLESGYKNELRDLRQGYIDSVRKRYPAVHTTPVASDPGNKSFNQDFIPVLERWFGHNPYPNADERARLARKSGMTSRQIEVWFQNHRTRAKKEGKILKPSPQDAPEDIFVEPPTQDKQKLKSHLPPPPIVITEDISDSEVEPTPSPTIEGANPLMETTAPPHAFPTIFPPNKCGYDPFPVKYSRWVSPPLVWYRTPSQASSSQPPKVKAPDIDRLCSDLATKLHFKTTHKKSNSNTYQSTRGPWFGATVTFAPRAPHTSLVCSPMPTNDRVSQSHPSPTTSSVSNNYLPRPATKLIPTSEGEDIRRLPRQTPEATWQSYFPESSSNAGPSPPSSARSRTPSLSSASASPLRRQPSSPSVGSSTSTTSRRRLSACSGSSAASSVIHTPISGQVELPDTITAPSQTPVTFNADFEQYNFLSLLDFSSMPVLPQPERGSKPGADTIYPLASGL